MDLKYDIYIVKGGNIAAGHFEGTGSVGGGNYCIAGHNSTIYAEVFNTLSDVEINDTIYPTDNDEKRTRLTYIVSEIKIVEPEDTWILQDYGDIRITIVTCTDDGSQRQVVIGKLKNANG